MKKRYLIIITSVLLFAQCNPDKEIAPENPCTNAQEVKADFVIEELVGDRYFEGDTIANYNKVRFRALQAADEYTWILGAETLHTQSFIRTNFPIGWLDVKLVIKRKPNKLCFPNDDGIDSASRSFYVWPVKFTSPPEPPIYPYYPIYGTYRGHTLSKPDFDFNVTLFDTFWKDGVGDPAYVGLFSGIPYDKAVLNVNNNNNANIGWYCNGISPKALSISLADGNGKGKGIYTIPPLKGYAWLDRKNNKQITIEYSYADTMPVGNRDFKNREVFIGTKIN
ncbi:MAG: hypothetical protein V4538_10845 [Bacteroidota bacterium]